MKYLTNHPDVTVGLVPCASGGKRIDLLKKGSNLYKAAMGKTGLALELGTIKGVLWHQGESDTIADDRANRYEEKLHALVRDLRNDLQIVDLPFIVGDLRQLYGIGADGEGDPDKIARIKLVRDALRQVPEEIESTGFVEMTGLTYSDAPKCTHFDRESYIILGQRSAMAYERVAGQADDR